MSDRTLYLAMYIGPQGPISAYVEAESVWEARTNIEAYGGEWFENGQDVLGFDPDGDTLDSDIEAALEGWELVSPAVTSDGYTIYRPAELARKTEKPDSYETIDALCEGIRKAGGYTDCATQPSNAYMSRYAHRSITGPCKVHVSLCGGRDRHPDIQGVFDVADQAAYNTLLARLEKAGARFNDTPIA